MVMEIGNDGWDREVSPGFAAVQEKVAVRDIKFHLKALQLSPGSSNKFDAALVSAWNKYVSAFREPEKKLGAVPGNPYFAFIAPQAMSTLRAKGNKAASEGLPTKKRRRVSGPADAMLVSVADVQNALVTLRGPNTRLMDGKTGPTTRSVYKAWASAAGVNGTILGATGKTSVTVSAASFNALQGMAQQAMPAPPPGPMAPLPPPLPPGGPVANGMPPLPPPGPNGGLIPEPTKAGMGAMIPLLLVGGAVLVFMMMRGGEA